MRPLSVIAPIVFGLNWSRCSVRNGFSISWIPSVSQFHTMRFLCSNTPCCTRKICSWSLWIKRRQFWSQQPSMNPAHFTGWVSSADQGPNLISNKRKRGFDGGPGLWSLISLIHTGILLINFLIRTHSKECCIDQHECYRELSHRHPKASVKST